ACQGSATNFTNTSTIANGSIVSYLWEFGTAVTSTVQNPIYSYPGPGVYNITLTAVSNNSCSVTKTHSIEIYPLPAANITSVSNVCLGNTTQFTGLSSIAPGHTVSFHNWSFGNGFFGTGLTPTHMYSSTG